MKKSTLLESTFMGVFAGMSGLISAQDILPFAPAPSGSKAGLTMEFFRL